MRYVRVECAQEDKWIEKYIYLLGGASTFYRTSSAAQAQEVQAGMQWGTNNTADDSNDDDDDDDGEVEDPDRALARATIIWRLNKTLQ